MVERAVPTIVEEDPDVALLGGDFVHSRDPDVGTQVSRVLELVAPLLDAGIPTFAVLGDHDHAVGAADELTTALEYAGVPVLADEAVRVPPSGLDQGAVPLYVVGIGPAVPGEVDVDASLDGVPDGAPHIVLMHDPTTFDRLPAGTAPLALAGHTHCGQVALPGAPRWSYLALTEEEAVVADGWARRRGQPAVRHLRHRLQRGARQDQRSPAGRVLRARAQRRRPLTRPTGQGSRQTVVRRTSAGWVGDDPVSGTSYTASAVNRSSGR